MLGPGGPVSTTTRTHNRTHNFSGCNWTVTDAGKQKTRMLAGFLKDFRIPLDGSGLVVGAQERTRTFTVLPAST